MKKIEELRKHLLTGQSITPLQAIQLWGYYRLSDGIFKLRKRGMAISTEAVATKTRYGRATYFARYKLEQ